MDGRKIIPVLLLILAYGLYNVRMWFVAEEEEDATTTEAKEVERDVVKLDAKVLEIVANDTQDQRVQKVKKRTFVRIKDACSVLDVFTKKPPRRCKEDMRKELRTDSSAVTMIGITVFLLVLIVNAVLDVLKVKEEERARLKQNPDGERRQSLAEFANRKPLKRESSRIGQQLFQIAEAIAPISDRRSKKPKPYVRGESTNSYLSERNSIDNDSSTYFNNMDTESRFVKRQSVAKLYGTNATPMMRRCSFPALPLNPEVRTLMMDGFRRPSTDSDEETDCKRRRIRLIRRY